MAENALYVYPQQIRYTSWTDLSNYYSANAGKSGFKGGAIPPIASGDEGKYVIDFIIDNDPSTNRMDTRLNAKYYEDFDHKNLEEVYWIS